MYNLMGINFIITLSQPQNNGIVILMSGLLLALGLYHFLLYFQNKDNTYLYYSLYAFLVFFYTYHRASHFVLTDISVSIIPYIKFIYDPIKWIYRIKNRYNLEMFGFRVFGILGFSRK